MSTEAGVAVEAPTLPTDAHQLLRDVLSHRGWDERDGQVSMVRHIHDSMVQAPAGSNVDITVSAPVGTGKTLGYLMAGLATGQRIVIATSTKSLQDQIVNEELPQLREDLKAIYGYDLTYGVLKGKSNYACHSHAAKMVDAEMDDEDEDLIGDLGVIDQRDVVKVREYIEKMAEVQASRDIARYDAETFFPTLVHNDTRRALRASHRCPTRSEPWIQVDAADIEYDGADIFAPAAIDWDARRAIAERVATESFDWYRAAYAHCMTAQVVVVNTTLLVFEIQKALNKFSEETPALLNGVGMVVVDESHHLARILAETYSVELGFESMHSAVGDLLKRVEKRYADHKDVYSGITALPGLVTSVEEALDRVERETKTEDDFREGLQKELTRLANTASGILGGFQDKLSFHHISNKPEGKVNRKGIPRAVAGLINEVWESVIEPARSVSGAVGRRLGETNYSYEVTVLGGVDEDDDNLAIKVVPVDVSFFRRQLTEACREVNYYMGPPEGIDKHTTVMTSGTITPVTPLTVGMTNDDFMLVPSPFDSRRARLYVPSSMPEPNSMNWAEEAWEAAVEAIKTVGGRTLFLTTSNRMLERFTEMAREDLEPLGIEVFSQADRVSKRILVDAFRKDETSVLLGTMGFWEGVDVPGPACSLVVIDKVPFPMRDDPVFAARRRYIEDQGGNSFMKVDVDHAAIMIAQGAGRLIRSVSDVGGVMILDSRINKKRYGSAVTGLLPSDWPMTDTHDPFIEWLEWVNPATREGDVPTPGPEWRKVKDDSSKRSGRKLRGSRR